MDVGGGVLEGLLVFDSETVANHGAADFGDEFLARVVRIPEPGDAAFASPVAAVLMHRRVGELVEGRRVVFLGQSVLREHWDDNLVPGGRVERTGRLLVIVEAKADLTAEEGLDGLLGLFNR